MRINAPGSNLFLRRFVLLFFAFCQWEFTNGRYSDSQICHTTAKSVSQICHTTDKSVTLPSKVTPAQANSAKGLIRLRAKQEAMIEALDWEQDLLEPIAGGATLKELAERHGVNNGSLSIWLNALPLDKAAQLATARKCSGQSLLDRGLARLESAAASPETCASSGAVRLAVAVDTHMARRAGLMDKDLNERALLLPQAPSIQSAPSFRINIISNGAPQTVTIDQEPDEDTSLI